MRRPIEAVAVPLVFAVLAAAAPAHADIHLSSVPSHVYKIADPGRLRTESWFFNVLVQDDAKREGVKTTRAVMEVYAGDRLRETVTLPDSTVIRMRGMNYRMPPNADANTPQRPLLLDNVFDIRLAFAARPIAWKADRVRVTLTFDTPDGGPVTRTLDVALGTYVQKTELLFPLEKPAIVTQGQINNSGHAGHSNQFAIDIMGLNAEYGPMVTGKTDNEEFAGWGMNILAPAAGSIVYARNDVPDCPADGEPYDIYSKLPDPVQASAGN
ncbi:MAG TPA: hypothetical protein VF720_15695, partial [Candidatus Eisenbacteria bacterium]